MRPVDDDLVGLGEPAGGREHRPGVAHRDVVAEEAADPRHRGREVDRAEHQHPRLGRERPHEHPHPLAAPLAVRAVGQRRVVARPPAARGRRRGPRRRRAPSRGIRRRPRRAGRSSRRPSQAGSGCSMTVARATGRPASMSAAISPSSGKVSCDHLLDEDVEDPAAGEPDRERVVVGDAVPLEHRLAGPDHRLGEVVDRALDAAAGDRADRGAVRARPASRRRAGAARTGTSPPRCRRRRVSPASPPLHQLGQHVTHGRPPPGPSRASPASGRRRSRRHEGSAARTPCCTGS